MSAFWDRLDSWGARPALIHADSGTVVSYAELAVKADRLRQRFATAKPALAFLAVANTPVCVTALLALLRHGAPVLPLALDPASPAFAVLAAQYRPELILLPDADAPDGLRIIENPPAGMLHPDLALLLATSGSTGSPKLARLSAAAVDANARQIVAALGMTAEDRAVTTLSFGYSFGLSVLTSHLACGASLLLCDRSPMERPFWRDLADHAVTTLPGVPFTFDILRRVGGPKLAPPSLRKLLQAGGRMAPAMIRWTHDSFAPLGAVLHVMYGQTEATARIATLPPAELDEAPGAVGYAMPEGRLSLDDAGQIIYRGPNVMMGYAETRADLNRGDDLGGVLATGDLGRLDEAGRLWITGRLKRIAKPFGLRVNLDDVETALCSLGRLAAVSDDKVIAICVETGDIAAITQAAEALATQFGLPVSLLRVRAIEALPRSPDGKIRYGEIAP